MYNNKDKYITIKLKHIFYITIILIITIFSYINSQINNQSLNKIKFIYLLNSIEKNFKGEINKEMLYANAIKGIIDNLDEYSYALINKDLFNEKNVIIDSENQLLKTSNIIPSNEYMGVGIEFIDHDSGIQIKDIYENSELFNIIHINDVITKINNTSFSGNHIDFINLLKGKIGDKKTIEINNIPFQYSFKLKKIYKDNVYAKFLKEDGIVYIKIKEFSIGLTSLFIDKYIKLNLDKDEVKGVIIDLSNNPGGVFLESIMLSDLIIDSNKTALHTIYNDKSRSKKYNLSEGDLFNNIPITLIVNKNSASSSEIFAGIFKYFNRGDIVGQNTYGKGVGQNVSNLGYKIEYAITTFEFFIGDDFIPINKKGVQPNIIVDSNIEDNKKIYIDKAIQSIKNKF